MLDMMLSITILVMVFALSLPFYQSFQFQQELDTATMYTVQAIRVAQVNSRVMNQDDQWGMKIQNGSITLFKGSSYASRNTIYDSLYSISQQIAVSGVNEVVFTKFYGETTNTGTITLTHSNKSRNISVNSKGTVNY